MRWRWPFLVAAALASLSGCTDRPIHDGDDGATATTAATDGAATDPSTSGPASSSGPTTSSSGPSTSGTSGPGTSGPTSTSGPSTATVTTDPTGLPDLGGGSCGDFWCSPSEDCASCPQDCTCPLPAGLVGCPIGVTTSAVVGPTPHGEFTGIHAFFAYSTGGSNAAHLNLTLYDASVDPQAAIDNNDPDAFALGVPTSRLFEAWIGESDEVDLGYIYNGEYVVDEVFLVVEGKLGSWDLPNPDDPPRLYGHIVDAWDDEVTTVGPFDAVFCDALVQWVIPE